MKSRIGIMQGRLVPRYKGRYQAFPIEHWKEEFSIAKSLGFDCIEFIYDYENYNVNPLMTENGIREIQNVIESSGVKVFSICADYFMKFTLFDQEIGKRKENINRLNNLMERVETIGVTDITIPCVDESSLKDEKDVECLETSLYDVLPFADKYGVSLNLETDLPPGKFYKLIEDLKHPRIKVNYDIGNSASLGFNPEEELDTYGKYISVLHIKDRVYKGGSVKLGTGSANFEAVFKRLKQIGFNGLIIMQAARAENYDGEIAFVKEQFDFFEHCLEKWFF